MGRFIPSVIDLNYIFLFLALISPMAVLARAWRPGGTGRSWQISAVLVLLITGVAWMFFRRNAGYVGGGAWVALLFLPAIGLRKVTELAAQRRFTAAGKLSRAVLWLHPSAELREQVTLFRDLEQRQATGSIPGPMLPGESGRRRGSRLEHAPMVIALIALNTAVFALELGFGLQRDLDVLRRLGALEIFAVIVRHEYWRLLTALFLHYNWIHLAANVFALYVLGPSLERTIGSLRFTATYLISGIGSTFGVLLLTLLHILHPSELVGASGCVMGIVGAWGGFLLRHRHIPQARRRLGNILMIVVVQTVFDIATPQVSMSAHLCGLVTGFFVGLLISAQDARAAA